MGAFLLLHFSYLFVSFNTGPLHICSAHQGSCLAAWGLSLRNPTLHPARPLHTLSWALPFPVCFPLLSLPFPPRASFLLLPSPSAFLAHPLPCPPCSPQNDCRLGLVKKPFPHLFVKLFWVLLGSKINALKTTPTLSKSGSYGIKVGSHATKVGVRKKSVFVHPYSLWKSLYFKGFYTVQPHGLWHILGAYVLLIWGWGLSKLFSPQIAELLVDLVESTKNTVIAWRIEQTQESSLMSTDKVVRWLRMGLPYHDVEHPLLLRSGASRGKYELQSQSRGSRLLSGRNPRHLYDEGESEHKHLFIRQCLSTN